MSLGCQLYRSGLEAPCKALQRCLYINNTTMQGVVQPGSNSPLSFVWQGPIHYSAVSMAAAVYHGSAVCSQGFDWLDNECMRMRRSI